MLLLPRICHHGNRKITHTPVPPFHTQQRDPFKCTADNGTPLITHSSDSHIIHSKRQNCTVAHSDPSHWAVASSAVVSPSNTVRLGQLTCSPETYPAHSHVHASAFTASLLLKASALHTPQKLPWLSCTSLFNILRETLFDIPI